MKNYDVNSSPKVKSPEDYQVFICYRGSANSTSDSRDGKYVALDIYHELKENNVSVFFAPKENEPGTIVKDRSNEILEKVSVVIMVYTVGFFDNCFKRDCQNVINSQSALVQEIETIVDRNSAAEDSEQIFIIPVQVDNYDIHKDEEISKLRSIIERHLPDSSDKSDIVDRHVDSFTRSEYSYDTTKTLYEPLVNIVTGVKRHIAFPGRIYDSILLNTYDIMETRSPTEARSKVIDLLISHLRYDKDIDMAQFRDDAKKLLDTVCERIPHYSSVLKEFWTEQLETILKKSRLDATREIVNLKNTVNSNLSNIADCTGDIFKCNEGVLTISKSETVNKFLSSVWDYSTRSSGKLFICEGRSKSREPFEDAIAVYNSIYKNPNQNNQLPFSSAQIITDCSIGELMREHAVTKVVLGACSVMMRDNLLIKMVNSAGTETVVMLAEKYNIPVYIVGESSKGKRGIVDFKNREGKLAIQDFEKYNSDDSSLSWDCVDYVQFYRTPNMIFVSENGLDIAEMAKYFQTDLNKDVRNMRSGSENFVKVCEENAYAVEKEVMKLLNSQNKAFHIPQLLSENDGKEEQYPSLTMQRVKGIRVFELFVVLDELAREGMESAFAAKARILARCNKNEEEILACLKQWGGKKHLDVYPSEKIVGMLRTLLQSLYVYYPEEADSGFEINQSRLEEEAEKLYENFKGYVLARGIPFRDSTIKNMALCIDDLNGLDHIEDETVKRKLKQKIKGLLEERGAECFDKYEIKEFDFASCINLTSQYDDIVGLNMHERSYNYEFEREVLKKYKGNEDFVLALFVRYLRFGGRKALYRLMCPTLHRIRFRFDNEQFYFAKFLSLAEELMPEFFDEYPLITALYRKLASVKTKNPQFDMIENVCGLPKNSDGREKSGWLGLFDKQ